MIDRIHRNFADTHVVGMKNVTDKIFFTWSFSSRTSNARCLAGGGMAQQEVF